MGWWRATRAPRVETYWRVVDPTNRSYVSQNYETQERALAEAETLARARPGKVYEIWTYAATYQKTQNVHVPIGQVRNWPPGAPPPPGVWMDDPVVPQLTRDHAGHAVAVSEAVSNTLGAGALGE